MKEIYIEKFERIKCPCSQEYVNKINCYYCQFNTKKEDKNYIFCNYEN